MLESNMPDMHGIVTTGATGQQTYSIARYCKVKCCKPFSLLTRSLSNFLLWR